MKAARSTCDSAVGRSVTYSFYKQMAAHTWKMILQFSEWFSVGIVQRYPHSNCIFDKGGFSVGSGLIFFPPLCSVHTGFSRAPPWVQWSPDHPIFWRPHKANVLILRFQPAVIPPQSPLFPPVPLSHSSEDPLALWSQSPVKGLKRLNSGRLLGPLWFTLSISPCPLSKFTTPKWGTPSPSFPSQRCFQVPPIGCRSCKP